MELDVVLAFAGGPCMPLRKQCSHYGGITFDVYVQSYTSTPYHHYIRWLVNGARTVDVGNQLMGELLSCFLDTTTAQHALHAHCHNLGYEKRADIVEAVIGAMHILLGDDVTGVDIPSQQLRQQLARHVCLYQCIRAVEIIYKMVSVMIVVTDVCRPRGISPRDLLL